MHTPVALIPEVQENRIEDALVPDLVRTLWRKQKALVQADDPTADYSIFQHVAWSLRKMCSPRTKIVIH